MALAHIVILAYKSPSGAVIEITPILACKIGFPSSQRIRCSTKLHLSHFNSTFVLEYTRAF